MGMTEFDRKVEEASRHRRQRFFPALSCFFLLLSSLLLGGCGGHKHTQVKVPPPPPLPQQHPEPAPSPAPGQSPGEDEKIAVPAGAKVLFAETGMASW